MEKSTVVIHSEICEKCGEATIIRKIWDSGSHTIKFLCVFFFFFFFNDTATTEIYTE